MLATPILRSAATALAVVWAVIGAPGCSNWETISPATRELPIPRMSRDSVAIEVTFVRVPATQAATLPALWQEIDEQIVSPPQRLHLNQNGFRCGLVGLQLPVGLRTLVETEQQTSALEESQPSDLHVLYQNSRIQCRAAKRNEIPTGRLQEEMVILHKDGQTQKVGGSRLRDAQCVLVLSCHPQGNGAVRVELVPEIHHGTPHRQWVAGEGTLHLVTARKREVYADLQCEVTLTPGQTLVLSCTPEFGLGHNFFVDSTQGDAQQKLLLIRLSQTQRDDLFEPGPGKKQAPADQLPLSEV